jgi:hypothetical protein
MDCIRALRGLCEHYLSDPALRASDLPFACVCVWASRVNDNDVVSFSILFLIFVHNLGCLGQRYLITGEDGQLGVQHFEA